MAEWALMKKLGYEDYGDYLRSDLWMENRARVLDRDNHKCVACDRSAEQVHHKNYTEPVMRGETIKALVSICRPCHKHIEFDEDGEKLSRAKANRRLKLRRRAYLKSKKGAGRGKKRSSRQPRAPRRERCHPDKEGPTILAEGAPCRKCQWGLIRRTHKSNWTPKARQRFYFKWWFYCAACKTTYLDNSARVNI